MNYFYVTGSSKGIGRALAERLLEDDDSVVVGLARGDGPRHERYRHVTLDLADAVAVGAYRFEALPDATRIVLVNNAAMMEMAHVGTFEPETIVRSFTVNTIAPALLTNAFVASYASSSADLVVCNITSGAAKNPVDGGALYGGSKSALNQMTLAAATEVKVAGKPNLTFMAVMPGSVDTEMQAALRNLDESEYALATEFRKRFEAGQLQSPRSVAERIRSVLLDPRQAPGTVFNLSELPL